MWTSCGLLAAVALEIVHRIDGDLVLAVGGHARRSPDPMACAAEEAPVGFQTPKWSAMATTSVMTPE